MEFVGHPNNDLQSTGNAVAHRSLSQLIAGTFALIAIALAPNLRASEGGSSSYLQGTYGDFATGMLGPKGFYLRNDLIYYEASIPYSALGRPVNGYAAQVVWGDLLKFAYISDHTILGGRYNAAILVPVLFGSKVTRHIAGRAPSEAPNSNLTGIGDIYFTPAALGWNWSDHHVNANLSWIAPTGDYDHADPISLGRNYWSFDPNVSYTWLHPSRGHELTLTLGYLKNWENPDSHYTTGDEVHIDWTVAQHFSERFAIGITGYWYEQVSSDSGDLPVGYTASDLDASGAGIGAAVLYTATIGGRDVSFIGKWLTDTKAENRLDGDLVMLSFALKL
jgi:hypothetical protein